MSKHHNARKRALKRFLNETERRHNEVERRREAEAAFAEDFASAREADWIHAKLSPTPGVDHGAQYEVALRAHLAGVPVLSLLDKVPVMPRAKESPEEALERRERERALVCQAVAPELAGMTPGSVRRRREIGNQHMLSLIARHSQFGGTS